MTMKQMLDLADDCKERYKEPEGTKILTFQALSRTTRYLPTVVRAPYDDALENHKPYKP